jgi:hypothetical protein
MPLVAYINLPLFYVNRSCKDMLSNPTSNKIPPPIPASPRPQIPARQKLRAPSRTEATLKDLEQQKAKNLSHLFSSAEPPAREADVLFSIPSSSHSGGGAHLQRGPEEATEQTSLLDTQPTNKECGGILCYVACFIGTATVGAAVGGLIGAAVSGWDSDAATFGAELGAMASVVLTAVGYTCYRKIMLS